MHFGLAHQFLDNMIKLKWFEDFVNEKSWLSVKNGIPSEIRKVYLLCFSDTKFIYYCLFENIKIVINREHAIEISHR